MFTRPGILFCIPFCNRLPRPLAPSAPPAPAFFGPLGGCGPQHGTTVVTCGDTVPNKQNKGLLKSGKSGTKQIAVVNSTSRCRLKMFKAFALGGFSAFCLASALIGKSFSQELEQITWWRRLEHLRTSCRAKCRMNPDESKCPAKCLAVAVLGSFAPMPAWLTAGAHVEQLQYRLR